MGVQEAHAGALVGALSRFPGQSDGAANSADVPATAHFYPSDPAIRLGPSVDLRLTDGRALSGAHVRIDAVRDGEAELLLYDLGGSRILPSIDYLPTHGVLDVHFVGMAPADAYAHLLSSLRYINRAAHPTPGTRSIDISILDANGQEIPVGHLDLTVEPARPALTVESLEEGPTPVADDDGPNPFALVVWEKADGGADGDGIVGWHRAGDVPQRGNAPRPASSAPDREDTVSDEPLSWDDGEGVPTFGGEALHLYGAADRDADWLTPAGGPLSPTDDAAADHNLPAADDEPQIGGDEYRIFMAAAWNDDRIGAIDLPAPDPAANATAPGSDTIVLSSVPAPESEVVSYQGLQPDELFTVDSAPAGGAANQDREAADQGSTNPQGSVPRLDAFLIGLPPSGDPLTAADTLAKPAGDEAA